MTSTRPTADELVQPRLDRHVAMQLAATEYDRMAEALAALSPDDWTKPTDCPAWDVRELGCHMVGMADATGAPFPPATLKITKTLLLPIAPGILMAGQTRIVGD